MTEAMRNFCLEEATIADVHAAMLQGKLTCRELVEMYLKRIEAYDQQGPRLNSIITINPAALEIADKLDQAFQKNGFAGPLHGIPVLLKDNVDTSDMPTTAGSLSLQGFTPEDDAFITKKMIDAGAIILAKVNLHEFAIWGETASSLLGQTLNPYDLTRTPGGSSGGTGAALAANFGMVGIGTDTINSVRSPASACSLVGFRPTLGLVSRDGIIPYSLTQDTAGPLARTVADTVKLLDAIAGYDSADEATAWCVGHVPETYTAFLNKDGMKGKRIGMLRSFFGKGAEHQEVNASVNRSIGIMQELGAAVVDIDETIDSNYLVAEVSVHLYDFKDHLNMYLESSKTQISSLADVIASGKYHAGIEENIKKAQTLSTKSPEYQGRLIARMNLQTKVMKLMADNNLDALVYPHQKRLVVPIGEVQIERNGVLGAVAGFPSLVVQSGFSKPTDSVPEGVPIGLEILGRPWSEPTLIEIGYAFEQATKFRRPPVSTPAL